MLMNSGIDGRGRARCRNDRGVGSAGVAYTCGVVPRIALAVALLAALFVIVAACLQPVCALASEGFDIAGTVMTLPDDGKYEWWSSTDAEPAVLGENAISSVAISGNVNTGKASDGVPGYVVVSGTADISVAFDASWLDEASSEWVVSDDTAKTVGGVELPGPVGSGAIILQSSIDRQWWSDEVIETNVLPSDGSLTRNLYTTKDFQLQNGCYYRLIVAHEMRHRLPDTQFLIVKQEHYEYKNVAEVFEFYAVTIDESQRVRATDEPRKSLGSKVNTGLDNGYSGEQAIDKDDPHYGWDMGKFFVNGYTREVGSDAKRPVFLKNPGDRVALWFHLDQDLSRLNGDDRLTVSADANGYDREFEVPQTDFGRGTLIVRFTDYQGVTHEPIIYTNFLAANAKTGADTRVQLFEEGDYDVVLDYEIARAKKIGLLDGADFFNYQIAFSFAIRNGNCMVYPMDALTNSELTSNVVTENGFKLDMARSRYLTIDVTRSVVSVGRDGTLTEDVRFNRPAKDGDTYTETGIYTFKVSNPSTGETTTKTIYVGTDKYLVALSTYNLTVAELNRTIADGYSVDEDGTLLAPASDVTDDGDPAQAEPAA